MVVGPCSCIIVIDLCCCVVSVAVGGVGGSKVAVGGLVISCSHCEVDGRWGRVLGGGLLCCVGVVIDGCARLLPGKLQSS